MADTFKLRRFAPVQLAVYAVVRMAAALAQLLPTSAIGLAGRIIGTLLYFVHPRRRVAAEQIAAAEGLPKDPAEIRAIVRAMYRHIGTMLVENLLMTRLIRSGHMKRVTTIEGLENVDRALERGRGIVLTIPHLGNWEWAALAFTLTGRPLSAVMRPIENPWLNRWIVGFRTQVGTRSVSKYDSIQDIGGELKVNRVLVLLADQDAKSGGTFVPFFGRPASTVRGPAILAMRLGSPVMVAATWRNPDGSHHVVFREPIDPSAYPPGKEGARRLTADFTAQIEAIIRRHPEQWMWLHRRWKSRPAEETPQDVRRTEQHASTE